MKKLFLLTAALCLCLGLVGCGGGSSAVFSFEASQISLVDVFTGGVPGDAVKKSVTEPEDVKKLVSQINEIRLGGPASTEDSTAGGIGLYLHLRYHDGKVYTVYVGDDGTTVQQNGLSYKMKKAIDVNALWESLDYEESPVPQEELPIISK